MKVSFVFLLHMQINVQTVHWRLASCGTRWRWFMMGHKENSPVRCGFSKLGFLVILRCFIVLLCVFCVKFGDWVQVTLRKRWRQITGYWWCGELRSLLFSSTISLCFASLLFNDSLLISVGDYFIYLYISIYLLCYTFFLIFFSILFFFYICIVIYACAPTAFIVG